MGLFEVRKTIKDAIRLLGCDHAWCQAPYALTMGLVHIWQKLELRKNFIIGLNGMRRGVIRIILIIIFFVIAVPFHGQAGGAGNGVLFRRYRYVTAERMEVETILEYMGIFQESHCSDLYKSFTRNGSLIHKFNRQYYFQEHYQRLGYGVFLSIEVAYKKPLFSRQRKFIIEINFQFGCFPTFEKDGFTELNVSSLIQETVNNFMSQFDEYVSNNDIELTLMIVD